MRTTELWIAGTYEARIRHKPRHMAVSTNVLDTCPVSVATVDEDEAPVVVEYTARSYGGGRTPRHCRSWNGVLWAPYLHYGKLCDLASFSAYMADAKAPSPFRRGQELKSMDEYASTPGLKVLSSESHLFKSAMDAVAAGLLVVGDQVYQSVPEPKLCVSPDGTPLAITVYIHTERHFSPGRTYLRLDRLDDAYRMAEALTELFPGASVIDDTGGLAVSEDAPLSFDQDMHMLLSFAERGRTAIADRESYQLDDDCLQALLDLRRIANAAGEEMDMDEAWDTALGAAQTLERHLPHRPKEAVASLVARIDKDRRLFDVNHRMRAAEPDEGFVMGL